MRTLRDFMTPALWAICSTASGGRSRRSSRARARSGVRAGSEALARSSVADTIDEPEAAGLISGWDCSGFIGPNSDSTAEQDQQQSQKQNQQQGQKQAGKSARPTQSESRTRSIARSKATDKSVRPTRCGPGAGRLRRVRQFLAALARRGRASELDCKKPGGRLRHDERRRRPWPLGWARLTRRHSSQTFGWAGTGYRSRPTPGERVRRRRRRESAWPNLPCWQRPGERARRSREGWPRRAREQSLRARRRSRLSAGPRLEARIAARRGIWSLLRIELLRFEQYQVGPFLFGPFLFDAFLFDPCRAPGR